MLRCLSDLKSASFNTNKFSNVDPLDELLKNVAEDDKEKEIVCIFNMENANQVIELMQNNSEQVKIGVIFDPFSELAKCDTVEKHPDLVVGKTNLLSKCAELLNEAHQKLYHEKYKDGPTREQRKSNHYKENPGDESPSSDY